VLKFSGFFADLEISDVARQGVNRTENAQRNDFSGRCQASLNQTPFLETSKRILFTFDGIYITNKCFIVNAQSFENLFVRVLRLDAGLGVNMVHLTGPLLNQIPEFNLAGFL